MPSASCRLGKHAQIDAQFLAVGARQKLLNDGVGLLPYRNSRDEKRPSGRGQFQPPRAFVGIIDTHFYQAAPLERFQISRQGRAVHGQQRGYAANARRLLAIERHQQRELAVCQTQRPQRRVKATRYCPRGPLQMQAEAGVAHLYGDREGKMLFT
jgi:hypothetical protein